MGLSTLHQLRGRVGRASLQAYAYFMYPNQLDSKALEKALEKLDIIQQESALGAGFAISERDRQRRGAGNFFGKAQKGSSSKVSVDEHHKVVQRVSAAPNVSAAATSFFNDAEATGVTKAALQWEAPNPGPVAATPSLSTLAATTSTATVASALKGPRDT